MDFYELLELIKRRPGMFLGEKKLIYLERFITGYYFGTKEAVHPYKKLYPLPFYELFQSYCGIKYQKYGAVSYSTMILEECWNDEEKALERFFEVLDEFKEKARITGCEVCNLNKQNTAFHQTEDSVIKTGYYRDGKAFSQPRYQGVERLYHVAFSFGAHMLIPESEDEHVHGSLFRQEESDGRFGRLDMFESLNPHMERCFGKVEWEKVEADDEQLFRLLDNYIFHGRRTKEI